MKNVYVTGSKGLIGSSFSHSKGLRVIDVDIRKGPISWSKQIKNPILVHLGWSSIPSMAIDGDAEEEANTDVENTTRLVDSYIRAYKEGGIIFLSSSGAMYNPRIRRELDESETPFPYTPYGKAKLRVERLLKDSIDKLVVLRCSNAWGGPIKVERRNGLIDRLIFNSVHGIESSITIDSESRISCVHNNDIANAICLSIKRLNEGKTIDQLLYHVSSETRKVKEIVDLVTETLGGNVRELGGSTVDTRISSKKLEKELGWSPRHFVSENMIRVAAKMYKHMTTGGFEDAQGQ